MRTLLITFFVFFFSSATFAQTPVPPNGSVSDIAARRLHAEIIRAAKNAGGTVGVSAVHIETGRRVAYHEDERFPMASTYKVPIAVQLLTLVDRGEISLERMIEIQRSDLHPESGILTGLLNKAGVTISIRNLLELMLVISDNSAADILLRLSGGPGAVTARMKSLGIANLEVHRPTINMIADSSGYILPPEKDWTPDLFEILEKGTTAEARKAASRKFEMDPRDTSTPESMARLWEQICRGTCLKRETAAMLLEIMGRSKTGRGRMRGLLPKDTLVANKTGTLGGSTNDTGVIALPGDAGHVILAVFIKGSEKEIPERERAIAQIARSIYDFFLFQPVLPSSR